MPSFYYSDAKDVFRARLQRLFRDYTARMTVIVIDVIVNGDKAFDWGWHNLELTSKLDGRVLRMGTRYFETWKRIPARGWVVTSFIDNPDETPRMSNLGVPSLQSSIAAAFGFDLASLREKPGTRLSENARVVGTALLHLRSCA